MKPLLTNYIVDAFTEKVFSGNPAAVCPLEKEWLPEQTMQQLAAENNLAETAFFIPVENNQFHIRWFTPTTEVKLCGHATLAAAHVLWNHLKYPHNTILFHSKSGILKATQKDQRIWLDFPSDIPQPIEPPPYIAEALGFEPIAYYRSELNDMALLQSEAQITAIKPQLPLIAQIPKTGLIVTAKGDQVDFVSRYFAPQSGVNEDPVTGSAHSLLIPFWAAQLKNNNLIAQQLSTRKGTLYCQLINEKRVLIGGNAVTYSIAQVINVE